MAEHRKKPTPGFVVTITIVVMLVFLALYVLSAGPATVLFEKGVIGKETLEMVYAPLIFVLDHVPDGVGERMDDYVDWCEGLAASTGP